MGVIKIGDILEVWGASVTCDGDKVRITGFHRLILRDGNNELLFDTSPVYDDKPSNLGIDPLPNEATVSIDKLDITPPDIGRICADDESSKEIELVPGKLAKIFFHYPNPLTPSSGGFWFKLGIKLDGEKYYLDFNQSMYGLVSYKIKGRGWHTVSLLTRASGLKTLTQWIRGGLPYKLNLGKTRAIDDGDKGNAQIAAKNCVLLSDDDELLLNATAQHEIKKSKFSFYVAADGQNNGRTCYRAATRLEIPRADSNFTSPVNAKTLGLHDALKVLDRHLSTGLKLNMDCLRAEPCSTESEIQKADPPLWFVEWHEIPTDDRNELNGGPGRLSFRSLWQLLTRQYTLGLQTLNAKSHLSFLPTDLSPTNVNADEKKPPWTLRYAVTHQKNNGWRAEIDSIHTSGKEVKVDMTLGLALNVRGNPLSTQALLTSTPGAESDLGSASQRAANLINLEIAPPDINPGEEEPNKRKILIGGVLLDLEPLPDTGKIQIMPRSEYDLGQPPLKVDYTINFEAGRPVPANEDPELGFETVSEWQERDRPLVIDLTEPQADNSTKVEIQEQANRDKSRIITILVRANAADNKSESRLKADVVVLDPCPLRIARVIAEGVVDTKDKLIATFRDDPENPMGWEFATQTGELELILPPQTIGEEMIKGAPIDTEPKPAEADRNLFDFRLSPSAWLHLDRTKVTTARATAPWALRRILGRRMGDVGLELLKGEFELLYGMTTRLEDVEGLRIADREALIGHIPFPKDLLKAWKIKKEKKGKDVAGEYAVEVAHWISGLFHHPSELPIFRDWADREVVVIDRGVEFDFRSTRQTCDPFKLDKYNPDYVKPPWLDYLENEEDAKRKPLRGGVDYGFESPNIYESVRKNAKVDRSDRPQGSLAGISFGALGGTGGQEALFDEGRTIIISKTTQGRLDSLTIVRVGRITMLWNHARHVIVYERSTRTAPPYKAKQPSEFEGLAALRKVKEYVEITQPHRVYPDVGGTERHAGPLVGSFFESTIIPVRSQWGNDITDGFVMPLQGPVEPGFEKYYPKPNIHLEFARAPGKGGKVSQLVKNPDKLAFFSSTREGEGSNPDAWCARADVDFPVTQRPKPPQVSYLPSFSGARKQPDALNHDYGQGRFTLETIPGEEAANLVHGRHLDGIEARIRNVSLARGMPRIEAPAGSLEAILGTSFSEMEAQIADALRELSEHTAKLSAEHAARLPEEDEGDDLVININGLRETGLKLLKEVEEKLGNLEEALKNGAGKLPDPQQAWKELQKSWHADSQKAWSNFLEDTFNKKKQLRGVFQGIDKLIENHPPGYKKEAMGLLKVALAGARTQALEKINGFAFVPQRALERLTVVTGRLEEIEEKYEYIFGSQAKAIQDKVFITIARWEALITDIQTRLKTESPDNLKRELVRDIEQSLAIVKGHVNDSARTIKEELGPLFLDLPVVVEKPNGPVRHILEKLNQIRKGFKTKIDQIVTENILLSDLDESILKSLREKIILEKVELEKSIKEKFKRIAIDLWKPFDDALKIQWQKVLNDLTKKMMKELDTKEKELVALIINENFYENWENSLNDFHDHIRKGGDGLLKKLITEGEDGETLLDKVRNELSKTDCLKQVILPSINIEHILKNKVKGAVIGLIKKFNEDATKINDLAEKAAELAKQGVGVLRNIGERIETAAAAELRDKIEGAADGALEMVRCLAEGPVTDTLESTRDWVGYYYEVGREALDLTRSAALFNDLGEGVLNSLSTQLPFDRLRDRLMPQLEDFDLNQLLPDFAGLKLEHLFSGVKIPKDPLGEYDWIDIRHGFDKHRLAAWSEVKIDREFAESLEVFQIGPLGLRVLKPRMQAESRFEKAKDQPVAQKTRAELSADWVVDLNGEPVLTIKEAALKFDESGDLDFDFKVENLQLAPALQFVTDALQDVTSSLGLEGLTITPVVPGGIKAELSLPLPDLAFGAFLLTGVTLYTHFDLLVAGGFEVSTGFWLSRPNRPFGLAILFLGGGGWFGVDVCYQPPDRFEARVSIGISAGAMAALNLGVAQGSAGILFTVGLDFYTQSGPKSSSDVAVSISMLVWGEFNIMGIASAFLNLVMRIEYRNGSMTGHGWFSLKIKICWCFTLVVSHEVHKKFSGSGNRPKKIEKNKAKGIVREAVKADLDNLDW